MATLLFTPFPGRGHIHPTLKLARELRARGHRVVYAGPLDSREVITKEGGEFIPVMEEQFPAGSFAPFAAPTLREHLSQVRLFVRRAERALQAIEAGALDSLFERVRPDLLVCDPLLPYPALVAHGLKIPTLAFNTNVPQPLIYPFLTDPNISRFFWMRAWLIRTGFAMLAMLGLTLRLGPYNKRIARRYGYPVESLATEPEYLVRGLPEMILAPREFAEPPGPVKSQYLFVGPGIDLERSEPDFPWERLAQDKPLVLFSMGSMGGYSRTLEKRVLDAVAEAAKARPQWQFVLAVNPTHETTPFDGVAPNVVAVKYAPLLQLLPRAAVSITHGGFNTVKECIHFGVPMVVVPLAYDQPTVGRLVERKGLGVVCPPKTLTSEILLRQLDLLVGDPARRAAMTTMRDCFHQREKDNSAADAVEQLLQARPGAPGKGLQQVS
ncbi:glycosyltransferase [Stigmatella erecta]|uniref:Glycosyltransferase, MGT family n=1 Tax=Stigmatella erecta TaxID=83460 RepID=A0A1I0FL37_9BACT|nr:glycosyltransferase [Stigmatella erecta]SET58924.1 glycosyltransferase, MGT family [Stigmatella erecta]